jgi:two-component system NarL family response regulator
VTPTIRVLLADPHVLFTDALGHLLRAEPDLVVDAAHTGGEALAIAAATPPDVALVELALTGIDGVATIRGLRALCPDTAILALAASIGPGSVHEVVRAGACGIVPKESPADVLVGAIRTAVATDGTTPLSRPVVVASRPPVHRDPRAPNRRLTERELEVLRLAATGMSNRRIAEALYLSEHTVLGYVKSLSAKLRVHSKLEAVVRGIAEGLIALPITDVDCDGLDNRAPRHARPSELGAAASE